MGVEGRLRRSIKILGNLAAGLDELGRELSEDRLRLTTNLRLAAGAGASALVQMQAGDANRYAPQNPTADSGAEIRFPSLQEWLDRLKELKGLQTDHAIADLLGVSKQVFSHWRTGKAVPSVRELWRIGNELKVDPLMVIASGEIADHGGTAENDLRSLLSATRRAASEAAPVSRAVSSGGRSQDGRPGRRWLPEDDSELRVAYESGDSVELLAERFKRSVGAILYRLHGALGLLTDDRLRELCEKHGVRAPEGGRGAGGTRADVTKESTPVPDSNRTPADSGTRESDLESPPFSFE